ncbi:MAG: Phosphoenolpyruvate synthase [Chlamydiae bacterium]|nr:Phosphoenolpyruvate synthase [Chlamydiota bacterium]
MRYIRLFDQIARNDVPLVGGKNASLGEMIQSLEKEGIRVPEGFATTAEGYFAYLDHNDLRGQIQKILKSKQGRGERIRRLILRGQFPEQLEKEICAAYKILKRDVAVRSSATAEDLPDASFAGQQESYLNIVGEEALLSSCKKCYASLFTDRAIAYREEKGFSHMEAALSIGVQRMVRADRGSSGVIFTLDTETGFRDMVVITSGYGLGENIVQGVIEPDEFMVFKPLLEKRAFSPIVEKALGKKGLTMVYGARGTRNLKTPKAKMVKFSLPEKDVLQLARWAVVIEKHYGQPMDIEWAKDGRTCELFIVQARPETVHSQKDRHCFDTYAIEKRGKTLIEGLAIGDAIVSGRAQVIKSVAQIAQFKPGSILVTEMTSPDWVPIMKKASGIITDHGGRTSHAAIVSRELGVPAIVGTEKGTSLLKGGKPITLSCAEGEKGFVYAGTVPFKKGCINISKLPKIDTDLMLNLASPSEALRWWPLPVKGVGLARMEFIINNIIKIHPMALVRFSKLKDAKAKREIAKLTEGYRSKKEYFVENMALGIGKIAASVYPHPVIVRMSDFKTNEYANLIGGKEFEPVEENPMLGFRGACRYYSPRYRAGFALECQAIKRVREQLGFNNVKVMIPFCRTLEEADRVLEVLKEEELVSGENGLEVYVMCEIPSNVVLAREFAERFDGFSIGSNDLTQLVLGVDRDAADLASLFDERNQSVKKLIREVIQVVQKSGKKIGICGQAPSDYPDFAVFLVEAGIDSISLNPDSVIGTLKRIAELSHRRDKKVCPPQS